jgi:hypothetical protein
VQEATVTRWREAAEHRAHAQLASMLIKKRGIRDGRRDIRRGALRTEVS